MHLNLECSTLEDDSKESSNGQEILARNPCPLEGFDSESIIKNNSRTFPHRSWTYDLKTGICVGDDANNCLPGFAQQPQSRQYVLAKPTKSIHCVVQKSMSRIFKTLASFLNDPLEFFLSGKDIIEDVFDRRRYGGDVWTFPSDWQHVMIVRDPIERFLSGYIHFCLAGKRGTCSRYCNNCGTDIACFIERQFKNTRIIYDKKQVDIPGNPVPHLSGKAVHMFPQTCCSVNVFEYQTCSKKYCDLNKHFNKYKFLYYNSNSTIFFNQQLGPFLRSRNVSDSILNYIRNRMTTTRTAHSTSGFEAKQYLEEKIRSTPYLLEMMIRMFYHDYVAFNIPFPTLNK
ncbi:hypothetical protein M3Y97_01042300 [Aphelenchoides bicaudatus]|nr:hypothetical protein M3Y97_01042300 [Aphelenchoides bicaudatus]